MNSNIRIAATQCSLGTWFVYGIDNLHKGDTEGDDGDDDDDDDDNNNSNFYVLNFKTVLKTMNCLLDINQKLWKEETE